MDDQKGATGQNDESLPRPIGTLFVMTVYLAILAGMWAVMLSILIRR